MAGRRCHVAVPHQQKCREGGVGFLLRCTGEKSQKNKPTQTSLNSFWQAVEKIENQSGILTSKTKH